MDQDKIRELAVSVRQQIFTQNEAEVSKRWNFEEGVCMERLGNHQGRDVGRTAVGIPLLEAEAARGTKEKEAVAMRGWGGGLANEEPHAAVLEKGL